MEKKNRTIVWWLELIVKFGILTVGFLEASSLTFGKPIISLFLWPTVFGGGVLLLIRLIHWKSYWKSKNFFLLIAFCASYLVSIVVNIRYGWYTNFRTLIWCALLFFLVYCYRAEDSVQENMRQFKILSVYYLIMNAMLSILSFAFMITGYSQIFYEEVGPIYYIGFHWGRLYGAYWDANIGAVMSCVGCVLAAGYFLKNRTTWMRVLLALDIVLEVAYIAFSDSRTGQLCLCVATVTYIFLAIWKKKKIQTTVLCVAAGLLVALLLPIGIKKGYNIVTERSIEQSTELAQDLQDVPLDTVDGEIVADAENDENLISTQVVGRADEYSGDITNRRSDIWKSAIEIFLTSPIVGISHNNVLPYVSDKLPNSYLITNDHMKFESMHNVFFDILVGQGIIGLAIYLTMAVIFLIVIIKKWNQIFSAIGVIGISCFVILMVMVTASCVMTEIVYVTSPMATLFWMSMSCLIHAAEKE